MITVKKKKAVYYIGFYDGKYCHKRGETEQNLAGSMKMDFIIQSLKKIGYKVTVISLTQGDKICGIKEQYKVDEDEEYIYLPYIAPKLNGKLKGCSRMLWYSLKKFAEKNFKKDSIVISYHSLLYGDLLSDLHKKIGFKWYAQVEELYCLSRKDFYSPEKLWIEEKMFDSADGFLFVNDLMKEKYANGKKCAVSYGNYKFFGKRKLEKSDKINIAYTGIINEDRGIFILMDAMKHLPSNYMLNVLGYGLSQHMEKFKSKMRNINQEEGYEKIRFCGTKKGEEFTKFLTNNDIGVSLMDVNDEVAQNAFPSKIMAYLGHSLYVVSSKCEAIIHSKVAHLLFFCDNDPQMVAKTILKVPVKDELNMKDELEKLENIFLDELRMTLEE